MSAQFPESTPPNPHSGISCLDAREVCARLKCCRTTLWRLQKRRRNAIPHIKLGCRIVYPEAALERWVEHAIVRGAR